MALFLREHAAFWHELRDGDASDGRRDQPTISDAARPVYDALRTRGALFLRELEGGAPDQHALLAALAELVAAGLVSSDGFDGLRTIVRGRSRRSGGGAHSGRWGLCEIRLKPDAQIRLKPDPTDAIEMQAWVMLRRYGVVFRRLLARELNALPWRELVRVYRRLEARGEIRGGRFVSGMSGEQFALSDAVERLREIRRTPRDGRVQVISAADPLNLAGIVTAGERVRSVAGTRIAYRNGTPVAVLEGDYLRPLADLDPAVVPDVASALGGRRVPPVAHGYIGARV